MLKNNVLKMFQKEIFISKSEFSDLKYTILIKSLKFYFLLIGGVLSLRDEALLFLKKRGCVAVLLSKSV